MKMLLKIVDFGIEERLDDSVKTKIRLGNILNLALIFLICFYSLISGIVIPEVLPYCLYGLVAYLIVLTFSFFRLSLLSRFLMSVMPAFVIGMLHAVIMQEGDNIFKELYAFQVIGSLITFSLFDYKRVQFWLPAFIISALPVVFIYELNNYFSISFDNFVFQQTWIRITVLFGAFFLGGFLFIFLQRLNQNEFEKAKNLANQFEEENKRATEKEKELERSLVKLEEAQEEEKKRSWATTGLAEIGSLLRGEENLQVLTDKIVAYMVKYLQANQGAMFLLDNEDPNDVHLILKAAYAFNRKKYLNKRVELGQGLVGQSFLEKDFIYLTEVPDNYVNITSGLGDANPRSILITPMIVNEEVYGVFEIASFKYIPKYQVDFMMELGENIAMTLNSFKINDKTKRLLNEMQEQSEQLRSQEEEMRQNMEELQATQEQQERQEKELLQKIQLLETEKQEAVDQISFLLSASTTAKSQ